MSLDKSNSNYSKLAKIFHWGFVILFIFLILLIIRFIYMKSTQTSSIPLNTPTAQKTAARIVHNGMYILLAGTVLSGLMIGFLYWVDKKNYILINIIIFVHEIIINILYLFIGVHIIAATYHRLKKDGVWSSMTPFFKEKK